MNENYKTNVDSRLDWSHISDVEYIPDISRQYEPGKVDNSAVLSNLKTVVVSSLLISILVIVSVFGGIVFLNSRVYSSQEVIKNQTEPTEKLLRKFVNTENLNLRSSPDRMSNVITILPYNTEVELLNKTEFVDNKYWVKVKSGNNVGWLNRDYLR